MDDVVYFVHQSEEENTDGTTRHKNWVMNVSGILAEVAFIGKINDIAPLFYVKNYAAFWKI